MTVPFEFAIQSPSSVVIVPSNCSGVAGFRSTIPAFMVWPVLALSLSRMAKVMDVDGSVAPLSFCAKGAAPPVTVTVMFDCVVLPTLSAIA